MMGNAPEPVTDLDGVRWWLPQNAMDESRYGDGIPIFSEYDADHPKRCMGIVVVQPRGSQSATFELARHVCNALNDAARRKRKGE